MGNCPGGALENSPAVQVPSTELLGYDQTSLGGDQRFVRNSEAVAGCRRPTYRRIWIRLLYWSVQSGTVMGPVGSSEVTR